jgi:hypothetical protein
MISIRHRTDRALVRVAGCYGACNAGTKGHVAREALTVPWNPLLRADGASRCCLGLKSTRGHGKSGLASLCDTPNTADGICKGGAGAATDQQGVRQGAAGHFLLIRIGTRNRATCSCLQCHSSSQWVATVGSW